MHGTFFYRPCFCKDGVITDNDWHDGNSLNPILHQGTNFYSNGPKQAWEEDYSYFNSSSAFVNQLKFAKW